MTKRVVVTGLGVMSPVGNNVQTFWQNLLDGISGIDQIKAFDVSDCPVRIAAEIRELYPSTLFTEKEIKRTDRVTLLGMLAAGEALQQSGLLDHSFEADRVGVIAGSGIGGISTLENQHSNLLTRGRKAVSPFFIPMMIPDIISGQISIRWGFTGPNYSVSSACATSAHAIGLAYHHIRHGDADVMITGGSEASITPLSLAGFTNMKAISKRNDEPQRASRPFDRERDGFVMGEGAGILVLEELEYARQRGAEILGEIVGYGFTADAYHITAPHPEGRGAAQSMETAIRMSGLAKEKFGHVNAHGTSTPLNDKFETLAIKSVFGEQAKELHINATKSMTGHLLGAAGAVECITTVLSLKNQIIPPTINYEVPDPECDLNYTPNQAVAFQMEAALTNNFGFGGHNAVLAVKRFDR